MSDGWHQQVVEIQSVHAQLGFVYWPATGGKFASLLQHTPSFEQQLDAKKSVLYVLGKQMAQAVPLEYMKNIDVQYSTTESSQLQVEWTPACFEEAKPYLPFYVGLLQDGSKWTALTTHDKSYMTVRIDNVHVLQGCLHAHKFLHIVLLECLRVGIDNLMQAQANPCGVGEEYAPSPYASTYTQADKMYFIPSHIEEARHLLRSFEQGEINNRSWRSVLSRVIQREVQCDALLDMLVPGSTSPVIANWFAKALANMLHVVTQSVQMGGARNAGWLQQLHAVIKGLFPDSSGDWYWYAALLHDMVHLEAVEPWYGPTPNEAIASSCPTLLRGMSGLQKRSMTWTFHMLDNGQGVKWFQEKWLRGWEREIGCRQRAPVPFERFIEGYYMCLRQPVSPRDAAQLRFEGFTIETILDENGVVTDYLCEQLVTYDVAKNLDARYCHVIEQKPWFDEREEAHKYLATNSPVRQGALEAVDAWDFAAYFNEHDMFSHDPCAGVGQLLEDNSQQERRTEEGSDLAFLTLDEDDAMSGDELLLELCPSLC